MKETKTDKKVGIWLDHTKAHFIDITKGPAIVETTFSEKETNVRFKGEEGSGTQLGNNRATNNEHHKHNREQEIRNEYYKVLRNRLQGYDDIYLFGPTTAKDELYNHLKADKHFANKTINIQSAEKLTENQMVAQVRKFFNL